MYQFMPNPSPGGGDKNKIKSNKQAGKLLAEQPKDDKRANAPI